MIDRTYEDYSISNDIFNKENEENVEKKENKEKVEKHTIGELLPMVFIGESL